MNSRKKGTGSEVNITLTMSNCYTAGPYVQILEWYSMVFLLHFDTDNCLLKKFHYMLLSYWYPYKHQQLIPEYLLS
jgi:hypothetical protein